MVPKSVNWLHRVLLIALYTAAVGGASIKNDKKNSQGIRGTGSSSSADDDNDGDDSFMSIPLIPHHVQKERVRQRQRARGLKTHHDDGAAGEIRRGEGVGALYQGYGTHYVDLWCGTPPQRQTLIVDTGSSVTAFPCHGCKDCGEFVYHADGLFEQELSSSFTKLGCDECDRGYCKSGDHCEMSMAYQEGSKWYAFEAKDRCYIGGPHGEPLALNHSAPKKKDGLDPMQADSLSFDLAFGCQTVLTGLFKTQLADGIMGMEDASYAFWKQLYNSKKTDTGTFALCFGQSPNAEVVGNEAGAMTLGGYDTRLHKTPLVYTEEHDSAGGYYNVHIRKIYIREGVDGEKEDDEKKEMKIEKIDIKEDTLNAGKTIVDSGTTDTYLKSVVSGPFSEAWKKITGKKYSQSPIKLSSQSELKKYPTIMIQLSGSKINKVIAGSDPSTTPGLAGALDPEHPYDVVVSVPPENYIEFDAEKKHYVPRIYLTEYNQNVLGGNFMMGHDVVFDIKGHKVGFAESDCDYTTLLSDNGFKITPNTVETGTYESPEPKEIHDDNDKFEDGH